MWRGTKYLFLLIFFGLINFDLFALAQTYENHQFITLLNNTNRLCQEVEQAYNLSAYFSMPEIRDDLIFVFYKSEIAVEDTLQASYALFLGLKYISAYGKDNELLAVVIYYKNNKAKIFSIRRKTFLKLLAEKVTGDELLKYMKIEVKELMSNN